MQVNSEEQEPGWILEVLAQIVAMTVVVFERHEKLLSLIARERLRESETKLDLARHG